MTRFLFFVLCVLANEVGRSATKSDIGELAGFLAISAQGLWAYARGTKSVVDLKKKAGTLIELVTLKLAAMSD